MKKKIVSLSTVFMLTFSMPFSAFATQAVGPGETTSVDTRETNESQESAQEVATQTKLVPDETSNNYAGSKSLPVFRVRTDKPWVALSFDAGSDGGNGAQIMDILEKYNIKSTFFLTGKWMTSYPQEAKAIVDRGHEIGNHSFDHPSFPTLSLDQVNSQLKRTHEIAKEQLGVDMCLFRFPYGDYNTMSVDGVKNNGYYGIQWSVDSMDWKNEGRDVMVNRVLNHKNLGNGSIILMHISAQYTPAALETVIQGILDKGYEIVPVSQLIYEKNYHMDSAGTQIINE